jgi:GNAT superfamily N-acetyltransferase
VNPRALSAELFDAIVSVAGTGRFLPYDKDHRWSAKKDERVIVQEIIHTPTLTVIPTLATRGRAVLKIHHYSQSPPDPAQVTEWSGKWCATYGAEAGRVIWLQDRPDGARTRLMLKTYTDQDRDSGDGRITELERCDVADTFPTFTQQLGVDGFAFLYERMKTGHSDGPILVAVDDRRIVGAVGPLTTMTDAIGQRVVPPQYFAVHPDYRRRGHGRALWRASMAWGHRHRAAYKVLQAQAGAPAEQLYLSEGLSTLGFVRTREIASD